MSIIHHRWKGVYIFTILTYNSLTAALQLTKFSADSTTGISHDAEEVPGKGYP